MHISIHFFNNYMKFRTLILTALILVGFQSFGQSSYGNLSGKELNTITTAVPFLLISPDARAGAMGDAGVSTTPDVYSMHWNPAKYAWMEKEMSIGLGYSPWLRNLVPDMNLAYLAFAMRLNDMSAVAATLRYFSLGDIQFTDDKGEDMGSFSPNEFAIDATYSRKLTQNLSAAVAGRFIYSHLTQGQGDDGSKAGTSIAADISVYWQKDMNWFNNMDSRLAWGINISNIGSKVNYNNTSIKKDFIPTNLRFGPTLTLDIDEFNTISFSIDINKLLVPTSPIYELDSVSGNYEIIDGKDPDVSPVVGIIQSFYDAPGGFNEELRELSFSIGAEYWYNKAFAVRAGYFHEDKTKGNRKYFTLGAGLRYNVFALDCSYLIPVQTKGITGTSPLDGTIRFNLTFDIEPRKNKTN